MIMKRSANAKVKKKHSSLYAPKNWLFWVLAGLLRCLVYLLSYKTLMKMGVVIGKLAYVFSRKQRKIARTNIRACFPEDSTEKQERLVRESFDNMGRGLLESALAWWASDHQLKKLLTVRGLEYVNTALTQQKGLFIFVPHFYSLYLCGRLANFIAPFGVMFLPPKNPVFRKITQQYIRKAYAFGVKRNDVRGLVKALKNNQALFYTPDTDPGKKTGEFIPFFNIPAKTLTATSRIAKMTGCAVMPLDYCRKEDGSGYVLNFQPALTPYPTGDVFQDSLIINQIVEKIILSHVAQYLWQYKRFKTRPVGEKSFYS